MLIEDSFQKVTKLVFDILTSHISYDLFLAEINDQLRASKHNDMHDNIFGDSIQRTDRLLSRNSWPLARL